VNINNRAAIQVDTKYRIETASSNKGEEARLDLHIAPATT